MIEALHNHRLFVLFSVLFLSLAGMWVATKLPLSVYPPTNNSVISADFFFDISPEEFYLKWGRQIEFAFQELKGVDYVEAKYQQGEASFFVNFKWGINADAARREVSRISEFYHSQQPRHYPDVFIYNSEPGTETYVAIQRKGVSATQLSELAKKSLIPVARKIEGVDRVWVSSPTEKYIHVKLNPYVMAEFQLSLENIIASLETLEYPLLLGELTTNGSAGEKSLYLENKLASVSDISSLPLIFHKGKLIRLGDIASVFLSFKDSERHFQVGDNDIVAVAMWPEVGANLYQVADKFVQEVQNFVGDSGKVTIINQPKHFIHDSVLNVIYSILTGIGAALILILIAYRRIVASLIIVFTIPLTLSISLFIMYVMGIGINILSLGAIAIVIGTVVDSAVVIVEHILKSRNVKVIDAMKQVQPSIFSSTFTSCIVFSPLLLTTPLIQSLSSELVLSAIILMLSSLLVSILLVPILIQYLLTLRPENVLSLLSISFPAEGSSSIDTLIRGYIASLPGSRASLVVILFLVILVNISWTAFLTPKIQREVIAPPKAEIIDVELIFNTEGLDLQEKLRILQIYNRQIESLIGNDIKLIYKDIRKDRAYLSVYLKSYSTFDEDFSLLQVSLKSSQDVEVSMAPWVTASLDIALKSNVTINIQHNNEEESRLTLDYLENLLVKMPEVERTTVKPDNVKHNQVQIKVKDEFPFLSQQEYFFFLERASWINIAKFIAEPHPLYLVSMEQDGLIPLKLSINKEISEDNKYIHSSIHKMQTTPLRILNRDMFVGDIFDFEERESWRSFYSRDQQKIYSVDVWVKKGINSSEFIEKLNKMIDTVRGHLISDGVEITAIDQSDHVRADIASLTRAGGIAVGLSFLFLLFYFGKLSYAFITLTVAGFGVSGALVSLYYFKSTLSVNSILGMLVIIGLTVNNAILIIDFYNINRSDNNCRDAIIKSISTRIKTLFVTTGTTLLAMLPIAFGYGAGQDIIKPLGITVTLGLFYSSVASILVVPMFLIFFGEKDESK